MINTKEQYDAFKEASVKYPSLRIDGTDLQKLVETIEALRRFVRAHTAVDAANIGVAENVNREEYNALVYEFRGAREALPDWIVDEDIV